jgi:hypothetical protein
MTNEEHIEEILMEASAFGLRQEVIVEAKKIMQEDPKIDKVLAYQIAFDEWIK